MLSFFEKNKSFKKKNPIQSLKKRLGKMTDRREAGVH